MIRNFKNQELKMRENWNIDEAIIKAKTVKYLSDE